MKRTKLVNRCLFSENNTVTFKDLAKALNAVRDYACNKGEFDNMEDTFLCELGLKWDGPEGVYVSLYDKVVRFSPTSGKEYFGIVVGRGKTSSDLAWICYESPSGPGLSTVLSHPINDFTTLKDEPIIGLKEAPNED